MSRFSGADKECALCGQRKPFFAMAMVDAKTHGPLVPMSLVVWVCRDTAECARLAKIEKEVSRG